MQSNNRKDRSSNVRPMGGGAMMRGGQKPKDFKKSLIKLVKHLKPYYLGLTIALIFASFGAAFSIIGPRLTGKMTNEVQKAIMSFRNIDLEKIASYGIWLIILYVLSFIFSTIQAFIMSDITQKTTKKLRSEIFQKINKLPLSYYDNHSYGDVLSRVTNDVDMIGQTLSQSLGQIIVSVTTFIGVVIMMLTISWKLTIVAFVFLPISFSIIRFVMKFSQKYFRTLQTNLGAINGHIEETYSGHNVIKVFNASENVKKEFDQYNEKLYHSAWRSQFFSGLMHPLMNFIMNLSYVVISVYGGILAVSGEILVGDIQSLMIYIRLFTQPLVQLAQAATNLQSAIAASERVFEFLEAAEVVDQLEKEFKLKHVLGNVEFKNVKFGYLPDKTVIKRFNAKIESGKKVAIVGPTGAGKTTIVNLLMRFYEIDEGDILIDGISIKAMKRENVRSLFGMVLQDTWLFKGTISENIAYGKMDATLDDIKHACKMANVDHFIESLPSGYDMVLDEDSSISQGQKQLLSIARAMVQNAPMLILDEATSSVDTRTEIFIQDAMDKLMIGRTTFVIAHRLSTIKNADVIFVLKDGDIVESGKHLDLLNQNGFYAELYQSQFENNNNYNKNGDS